MCIRDSYNSSGEFNTPFGRYVKPYFPEKEMLYFARKAQKATFACRDFRNTMAKAKPGDAVYCDPPYVPLSGTANFTEYSSGGFGLKEQQKLAEMAGKLAEEGIPVLLSNHDTAFVRQIYRGAQITSFKVRRFISCQGDNRNKAGEILASVSYTHLRLAFAPHLMATGYHAWMTDSLLLGLLPVSYTHLVVSPELLEELTEACRMMSQENTGALIVLKHKTSLAAIIETGDEVDARISRRLLLNIFFKNSPLHDGALIIANERIQAVRCTLPILSLIHILQKALQR